MEERNFEGRRKRKRKREIKFGKNVLISYSLISMSVIFNRDPSSILYKLYPGPFAYDSVKVGKSSATIFFVYVFIFFFFFVVDILSFKLKMRCILKIFTNVTQYIIQTNDWITAIWISSNGHCVCMIGRTNN